MSTPSHKRPLVVGIVGGIGSGKSAVAAAFASRGAQIIGADELGHEALRQPEILQEITRRWGTDVLDELGQVNRKALGKLVFADPHALKQLESLTHPWIRRRTREQILHAGEKGVALVILDAAIMLEAGWNDVCDRLVYVDAPAEIRRERVMRTRGWGGKTWEERESAQMTLTEKRAHADHVLDNSSTLEHLDQQVDDLLHCWGVSAAPVSS